VITNGALAQEPYKISNSEIQTFKDCKRKWWLGYYRRLQPKAQKLTGPLALGSRIHEALDVHYSTGKDLIEVHNSLLAKDKLLAQSLDMYTDTLDSEGELGRIMLEGFLEWSAAEGIDADLEMISTEEILSAPLLNGRVELQGKLDMRVRRKSDGVRLFRDWKTVGTSFSEFAATAQMNEQILTYMLLESLNTPEGERSSGGIFTLLRKVKRTAKANPPFYEQFEVNHNVFTLRSFWTRIHGELNDIMAVKDALDAGVSHQQVAYPRPSKDCTWKCEFFAICPMFDDGSAVEDAVADIYEVSDPYAYYADSDEKKGSE
jgi:hypothetical protein